MESWTTLNIGTDGYMISSIGRIKSTKQCRTEGERFLSINIGNHGYCVCQIRVNGLRKTLSIHRLVAQSFLANPDNKPCVNHKNGIKTDNRVRNLEWTTYSENNKHARDKKLWYPPSGERSAKAKLTNDQVREIRKRLTKGERYNKIAKDYGVSRRITLAIKNNKTYKNVR